MSGEGFFFVLFNSHMKNYIAFVNDHSGSMHSLAQAACKDFNANIKAIKKAATREMLDTVVSVAEVGYVNDPLPIQVSNPHVLKEKLHWVASGGTPLFKTTLQLLNMLNMLPDAKKENVSFLVMMTTDGEDTSPEFHQPLQLAMEPLLKTGRWTFVVRAPEDMPRHQKQKLLDLGIPAGNIQAWDTTVAGMAVATEKTTAAMNNYFTARSAGAKSSSSFFTDASKVDITALKDVTKEISLYVVPDADNGIEIRPFVLRHRMEYLKGSAFYQLTKTESRVGYMKQVLVRDRASGKFFSGKEARDMIGLPTDRNARLHPGDHKNFDIFIQSESVNRKLVGGTGVAYWKAIGVPFTEADLAYLKPKEAVKVAAVPAPVVLPAVPVSNKPTKSPIPVAKKQPALAFFETREEARRHCAHIRKPQSCIQKNLHGSKKQRWSVPAA